MLYFVICFSIVILASETRPDESTADQHLDVSPQNEFVAQRKCKQYTEQACNDSSSPSPFIKSVAKIRNDDSLSDIRLIIGAEASPKEHPYMALIGRENKYKNGTKWFCGGTLISENFILTAAHCSKKTELWIRLGELDYANTTDDATPMDFIVQEQILHPSTNIIGTKITHHDIAVFRFQGLTNFTNYIRPICLNVFENIPNQRVIATGWGRTSDDGLASPKLRHVDFELQSDEKCYSLYNNFDDKIMICAGYARGGKATCKGDSGGPLLIFINDTTCPKMPLHVQVGITAGGKGCGLPDTPKRYTRVSNYIPWIESIVWKTP